MSTRKYECEFEFQSRYTLKEMYVLIKSLQNLQFHFSPNGSSDDSYDFVNPNKGWN